MSVHAVDRRVRRALAFTPMETRRDVLVRAAVLAEELGYEAVIVPEGWGLDAGVARAADPLLPQVAVYGDKATVHTGLAAWDDLVDIVAVCVAPAAADSVLAQVAAGAPEVTV